MNRDKLYQTRYLAGCVRRYHTWPMIKEQTVGHHCWRVATIFVEVFGMPRAEVLYYCLHHDSGELWAGDIPYGTKRFIPGLKSCMDHAEEIGRTKLAIHLPEITKEESVRIKICDLLEMHETGKYEMNLGNKYAEPIVQDTMNAAMAYAKEACMSQHVEEWLLQQGSL